MGLAMKEPMAIKHHLSVSLLLLIMTSSSFVSSQPVINEILLEPYPASTDESEHYSFVEIYLDDPALDLGNCSLRNANGSYSLLFPPQVSDVTQQYFLTRHRPEQAEESIVLATDGLMEVRDFDLNFAVDGLALICDEQIVDYIAWTNDAEIVPSGHVHTQAVTEGQWGGSFIDTLSDGHVPLEARVGLLRRGVTPGDSLGRDATSTDTNTPQDWQTMGGRDAIFATPSAQNAYQPYCNVQNISPDEQQPLPEAEWTIMSFIDSRDAVLIKPYFIRAVRDILSAGGSTDDIRFVVQYENCGWTRTFIENPLKNYPIPLVQGVSPADEATLSNFISWAKQFFPAKKYMLHLLGHGDGWKGINIIDSSKLSMSELRGGVGALGQPFDVVYFESCLMGGLEVAYQIADRAKHVTFSEEIMYAVTNYGNWAKTIVEDGPNSDGLDMSKLLAEMYKSNIERTAYRNVHTISAVDLSKLGILVLRVDTFAAALKVDMADYDEEDIPIDNLNVIYAENVLPGTEDFYDENFVDLFHLAARVAKQIDFLASGSAGGVMDSVTAAVSFESHGNAYPNAHGLHIYHPRGLLLETKEDRAYDNPFPSDFLYAQDTLARLPIIAATDHSMEIDIGFIHPIDHGFWSEFLIRFYKPTANACIRDGDACVKSTTIGVGEKRIISGRGSSDIDGGIEKYYWDLNPALDSPAPKPTYMEFQKYEICTEDCDRNDIDDEDDDPDLEGETWEFVCLVPGEYQFKLIVWDEHHLNPKLYNENVQHNGGNHYLHFQVDSEAVNINCTSNVTTTTSNTTTTTTTTTTTYTTTDTTTTATTATRTTTTTTTTTTESAVIVKPPGEWPLISEHDAEAIGQITATVVGENLEVTQVITKPNCCLCEWHICNLPMKTFEAIDSDTCMKESEWSIPIDDVYQFVCELEDDMFLVAGHVTIICDTDGDSRYDDEQEKWPAYYEIPLGCTPESLSQG